MSEKLIYMIAIDLLKNLVDVPSPSGYEQKAQSVVSKIISPYVDEVTEDIHGNLICRRYAKTTKNAKTIMLMAHIDEIGMMVAYVEPSGFVRFNKLGGVDPQLLQGHSVIIMHEGDYVKGVIGSLPIHMKDKDVQRNVTDISDVD